MDTLSPGPAAVESAPPPMSLGARLLNMYATPGDVFDWLRQTQERHTINWLAPVLLSCLAGIIYTWVALSQPNVEQQIREQQDQKLQQLTDSGKMSEADLQAARTRLDQINLMSLVKVSGSVAVVATSFAMVFLVGLVLKVTARWWLRSGVEYMRWVEVAGLCGMITVLGTVVQLLLVIIKGSVLATPGPVLLVGDIDPHNKIHLALASMNLLALWYLCVLGIGLGKLAGASFLRAVGPLVVLWLVVRTGVILLGWASTGM